MSTAIIVAIIGGAGAIITAITALIFKILERKDKKKSETLEALFDKKLAPVIERQDKIVERLDKIEAHNAGQDKEIREIRLDTLRTQMYLKFDTDSSNHDTIFKIAEKYFCIYHGDWIATVDFQNWADKEGVKIPEAILRAIAENDSK